jgi:hypothetical protein
MIHMRKDVPGHTVNLCSHRCPENQFHSSFSSAFTLSFITFLQSPHLWQYLVTLLLAQLEDVRNIPGFLSRSQHDVSMLSVIFIFNSSFYLTFCIDTFSSTDQANSLYLKSCMQVPPLFRKLCGVLCAYHTLPSFFP